MMLIILCVCEKRRKICYSQIILREIVSVKCCLMGSHRFILFRFCCTIHCAFVDLGIGMHAAPVVLILTWMRDVESVELMNPVWSWNYFHTHIHILFYWTQSQGSGFVCLFRHSTNSQSVRYAQVNTSIQALLPQIMKSSKAPDLYRVM